MIGHDVAKRDLPQSEFRFGIWSSLALTYAILSGFISFQNLNEAAAAADAARAAAESYNARIEAAELGATPNRPERDQSPWKRRDDDLWHLNYLRAGDALVRARLGVDGWKADDRLERLGLNRRAFEAEVDGWFGRDRGSEGPWERAEFGLLRKSEDAVKLFEAAVADGAGAVRYAKRAAERGDAKLLASAESVLEKFAGVPGDAAVWVALGSVRAARGDKAAALEAFQSAARAGPHDMEALRACGRALGEAGRRDEAVALYAGALAGAATDEDRFELLDRISTLDRKWIHVNGAGLTAGLLPAYEEHRRRVDRRARRGRCLDACAAIEWDAMRAACRADCYAVAGD
jgi:tetratricopeptide (TPR) repeat protein